MSSKKGKEINYSQEILHRSRFIRHPVRAIHLGHHALLVRAWLDSQKAISGLL